MTFNYKNIYIGNHIEKLVKEKGMEPERICRFLNLNEAQLQELYQSKSIDTDLLLRCSKLLEYDFFRMYSQHLLLYAPPASTGYTGTRKTGSSMPSFQKKVYTPEIIHFIVELVTDGTKTSAEIIKEYRIPKTTLYKWLKKHQKKEITFRTTKESTATSYSENFPNG